MTQSTPDVPSDTKPSPAPTAPTPMALGRVVAAARRRPPACASCPSRAQARARSTPDRLAAFGTARASARASCRRRRAARRDQSRRATSSHERARRHPTGRRPWSPRQAPAAGSPSAAARSRPARRRRARGARTHTQLRRGEAGHRQIARDALQLGARLELSGCTPCRCARRSRGCRAGARGRTASSSVAPCICPDRPIASTSASAAAWPACSSSIAAQVARHQSSGSCSLKPGRGWLTDSGWLAVASTRSSSSSSAAFTPEVPRSMPRVSIPPSRPQRRRCP